MNYIITFAVALIGTAIATPIAIKLAPKIGAIDVPKDNRRMHDHPIPRFGGIAIFGGVLAGFIKIAPLTTQTRGLLISTILILALGIADDLLGMKPKVKLAGQIICAVIAWSTGTRVSGIRHFFEIDKLVSFPAFLSFVITILWIVGITNTINLIDGLDGLAAGTTAIAAFSIAYTANVSGREEMVIMAMALAGACIGFLFYNFNPAKIFMGDAGSMQLGFLLSTISLIGDTPTKSTTLFATIVPIMILALPIFDTSFAILRRLVNHKPIMQADKGHIHHRLMAMGLGQKRTVITLYAICVLTGIAGVQWTLGYKAAALLMVISAIIIITSFIGVKFDKEAKKK